MEIQISIIVAICVVSFIVNIVTLSVIVTLVVSFNKHVDTIIMIEQWEKTNNQLLLEDRATTAIRHDAIMNRLKKEEIIDIFSEKK